MNDTSQTFNCLGSRPESMACRMLGFTAEAEEVVQDTLLHWHETSADALEDADAWQLVCCMKCVMLLCMTTLRS